MEKKQNKNSKIDKKTTRGERTLRKNSWKNQMHIDLTVAQL
jgi:hypothetical protein